MNKEKNFKGSCFSEEGKRMIASRWAGDGTDLPDRDAEKSLPCSSPGEGEELTEEEGR